MGEAERSDLGRIWNKKGMVGGDGREMWEWDERRARDKVGEAEIRFRRKVEEERENLMSF